LWSEIPKENILYEASLNPGMKPGQEDATECLQSVFDVLITPPVINRPVNGQTAMTPRTLQRRCNLSGFCRQ